MKIVSTRTKISKFTKFSLAGLMLLAQAGCASITKGTQQEIAITSNVEGADIYLDGVKIGVTPFKGKVKKDQSQLRIEKAGYQTGTMALSKKMEGMFWGNIIFGGLLGSTTDITNGAAYAYSPATYQLDLQGNDQASLEYDRQSAARKFAMIYIDDISRDLAAGGGDHLSALVDILDANATITSTASRIRSALITSAGDQVQFGNAMAGMI